MGAGENTKQVNLYGSLIIGLLMAGAYKSTFLWMFNRYTGADSYYSHGFIVPLVSLFLIYLHKERLAKSEQKVSFVGLAIVIFSLVLHVLGTILYIFSISGFSIFFLVIGLSLFLYGREITRIIWFPLCFLVFMFPLPQAVISIFAFPMKLFAARAGVFLADLFGVPVFGKGFNIFIPAGHLLVGNPCSGLRSLIAFLALGAMFAYLKPISPGKKIFLFLCTIPIALFSNIVRVSILVLISHYWGLKAAAPDTIIHTGSGILVFIVGFLLLITVAKVLEWRT
jgi:exosortase